VLPKSHGKRVFHMKQTITTELHISDPRTNPESIRHAYATVTVRLRDEQYTGLPIRWQFEVEELRQKMNAAIDAVVNRINQTEEKKK
jgi:hypothetical protein